MRVISKPVRCLLHPRNDVSYSVYSVRGLDHFISLRLKF